MVFTAFSLIQIVGPRCARPTNKKLVTTFVTGYINSYFTENPFIDFSPIRMA